ncbi:hypothetical protein CRG98_015082 [Punica granatum]|uniref:Uncharacterized protein n=1 Tax=Punica granatum TaxID=22663 RepID=A0A2I0K7I9_PUNGR|nr:hypothetical protein CRG98_015082 [Punica granatum]
MIAKSKEGEDHLVNLKRLFDRLKEYKLRLNPAKCTFGARSGKLLGFVESERGIEVDPDKVKAIKELPPPSTVRELTEYDIEYVSRTSVKGQAIADHLAEFPVDDETPIDMDFPDEGILQVNEEKKEPTWKVYFDGAVNSMGSGIGAVLISPDGHYYPVAAKIDFPCTNNVAEYEACILGLQAAIDFKVKELKVFGDSMLTIFQTLGQWKTKDAKLVPYHEYLEKLTENFEDISFTYTPRMANQFADALATLASMNLLQTGQYPPFADRRDRKTLRRLAIHYFLTGEILYRRSFDSTLLRCIDEHESRRLMEEVHGGNCGPHMNSLVLAKKIMRLGYYCTMAFFDVGDRCDRPDHPKASNGHMFILVVIDYFTRWIEAITIASVTAKAVARFLRRDVIARYGVPATIITDNAKNLNNKVINELCAQFKIRHRNSTPYHPQMNGAVEAANKNIKKIIEKMTVNYKDWHEMLPYALLAYRTSIRTSTGANPYSLVYGMEAVLPTEVEIPSMRILAETELAEAEWAK